VKGFGIAKPVQQESYSGYLILVPKYELIWSEVAQVFSAEVPELPGCAANGVMAVA